MKTMSLKPLQLPHKLWAIIPAAGSGSRFSQTELKQYQMIGQKTVLEHTVSRLNQLPLQGYVLAIGSDDDVAQSLPFSNMERAHFCEGGAERVDSVLNALNYLSTIADADDWVFVHDAARPCVTQDCLVRLVDTAIQSNLSESTTKILASLTPREERVLRMRFGIGMNTDHTLEEVGLQFSVTRERIRQIEAKALRKLKHPSRSKQLKSFLES